MAPPSLPDEDLRVLDPDEDADLAPEASTDDASPRVSRKGIVLPVLLAATAMALLIGALVVPGLSQRTESPELEASAAVEDVVEAAPSTTAAPTPEEQWHEATKDLTPEEELQLKFLFASEEEQAAWLEYVAPEPEPVASSVGYGVWDRLAQCESGGNWGHANGDSFDGGLQFHTSTWRSYGGTKYAARAYNATREQQIEIAEKVLASAGWGAWPGCSRKLGLR